jgi:hypothetical protein
MTSPRLKLGVIKKGASVDDWDVGGDMSLLWAAEPREEVDVRLLAEKGASVHKMNFSIAISSADNRLSSDDGKRSPLAFLDLSDSVCSPFLLRHTVTDTLFQTTRLGTNVLGSSVVSLMIHYPILALTFEIASWA